MLIKTPRKHVLTDYRIASLLGLTKHDPKSNEVVGIGLDGSCHVRLKLSKTLEMPIRLYSPTSSWADAGPAFKKFGYLLTPEYGVNFYNLPEAMRTIVESFAEGDKQYENPPLVELLFGPDWYMNADLI